MATLSRRAHLKEIGLINKPNLNIHFNAPSVRYVTWGKVRNAASQLVRVAADSDNALKLQEQVDSLLKTLAPMEA